MAKTCGDKPGEKARWLSRFGAGWIADAQYLAETMCQRLARSKQQDLPLRFWDRPEWSRFFMMQLRLATVLLKEFVVEAILAALKRSECESTFSLRGEWLRPHFVAEQAREEAARAAMLESPTAPVSDLPAPSGFRPPPVTNKKSILSKLRDL